MPMTGHFICNHLISVDGDQGEGEIYSLVYHVVPDGKGGYVEDLKVARFIDRYRKENGRWLFANRVVSIDHASIRPAILPEVSVPPPAADPSYTSLSSRLFARGART